MLINSSPSTNSIYDNYFHLKRLICPPLNNNIRINISDRYIKFDLKATLENIHLKNDCQDNCFFFLHWEIMDMNIKIKSVRVMFFYINF